MKKNLRQIPSRITEKIAKLPQPNLVAAVVRKIPLSAIAAGDFAHIGLDVDNVGRPEVESPVMPSRDVGIYSRRNLDGYEVVRKDLPMVTKTFSWETPNWGDWSNGSHTHYQDREVYQRDVHAPREVTLTTEILAEEGGGAEPVFVIKVSVDEVFDRDADGFEDDLLFALNLLQENVGGADVYGSDATRDDYLKTIYVDWEILPPGQRDATIAHILSKMRRPTEQLRHRLSERYDLLAKMKPVAFISGTSGFSRYFGAQLEDDLVVFENLDYGNAAYVMYENWPELSQRTRLELLSGDGDGFDRVVHAAGWEDRLRAIVHEHRAGH